QESEKPGISDTILKKLRSPNLQILPTWARLRLYFRKDIPPYPTGISLLALAVEYNILRYVEEELRKDRTSNNAVGRYGTMLQTASFSGNLEVVRLLLEKGAEVNAQGGHYGNPLQAAAVPARDVELLRPLLVKADEA